MISVILPTYNEARNIGPVLSAVADIFRDRAIDGEIIVVDDDSPDGTAGLALERARSCPVRVRVRKGVRGLSGAVIEGFRMARGEICVVMDADLSHPVEKIPALVRPILEGRCDLAVGSRYLPGGGTGDWPLSRRIISRGAGLLARGLTPLSDPTSGFMALRKSILRGVELDPLGWKIVLEVVVKTRPRILEVPIVFRERREGKSKLGFRAQLDYLRHLARLYTRR